MTLNIFSIVVIIISIIIIGIDFGVKFFRKSVDDQKTQIKTEVSQVITYIKECLPDLITQAEQTYGEGTGIVKKSAVFKALIELLPSLEDYITDGDILTDEIGDLIDKAVEAINDKVSTNPLLSDVYSKK